MRILEANEVGTGILIEYDAGYVSMQDERNKKMIKETYGEIDYKQPFEFYAVLQKYDTPNRNGRVYPKKILQREAEKYKNLITKGTSVSELNHPDSSLLDLDRLSHIITEVWWEDNALVGKIRLLTSPGFHESGIISCKGDIAANYMRQGVTMGISSRGIGSLVKNGETNEVQEDFELICFDLVSTPSTPGAYLYLNKEDRAKYDEKIEVEHETKEIKTDKEKFIDKKNNLRKDLMSKLNNFLDN